MRPTRTSSEPIAALVRGNALDADAGRVAEDALGVARERAATPARSTRSPRARRRPGRACTSRSPGRSGSSRIFRVSSRSLTSSSYSTPSNSQSMRSRWSSGSSPRSASIASVPAPETDWYVATRTLRSPAASCSGASAIVSGMVQQFGFATMPSCSSARLSVHLRNDERDAGREAERRRLVHAEGSGRRSDGNQLAAERRPDREQADVEVAGAERLRGRLLDLVAADGRTRRTTGRERPDVRVSAVGRGSRA